MRDVLLSSSSLHITTRRISLVDMKKKGTSRILERGESSGAEYPDVWGERSAPPPAPAPGPAVHCGSNPKALSRQGSKPFSTVVQRGESQELLLAIGPDSQVEVDMEKNSDGSNFWERLI